jgi:hypothetical protein
MLILPFYNNTLLVDNAVMTAAQTAYNSRDMPLPPRTDRCTIFFKLTSNTGTEDVTVKARMVYGAVLGTQFTLGVVTATTTGADLSKRLERDFSAYFDPNASDVRVDFSKAASTIITIKGGMSANPSR